MNKENIMEKVEREFTCTPLRRIIVSIFLAAVLAVLLNWFLTGPYNDYVLNQVRPPLTIYSVKITVPTIRRGGVVQVRLDSIKHIDCDGEAGSWLESADMDVWNLPSNKLGAQPIGKRRIITIRIPIPEIVPPGRYRLVRTLEYNPPCVTNRIRFPNNMFFEITP